MVEFKYAYSEAADFPNGEINKERFEDAIRNSGILVALARVDHTNDLVEVVFKAAISAADKTILDGDTSNPAGGLIAVHIGTPSVPSKVEIQNHDLKTVQGKRTEAKVMYSFSPNLSDKKTWYLDAVQIQDEVLSGADGVQKVWSLDCGGDATAKVLQVYGYITDGYSLSSHGGTPGEFRVTASVDSVPQAQDRPHRSVGDKQFSIDAEARTITFHTAPANGVAVTVSYWYVPTDAQGHIMKLKCPPVGKKWTVDYVEAQFSKDTEMNDTVIFGAYPYEKVRDSTIYGLPLQPELHYTTLQEVTDYNIGSKPVIPAVGTNSRGFLVDKVILPWEYVEELSINNNTYDLTVYGLTSTEVLEFNARLEEGIPFSGERATITIRIIEEDA